MPENSSPRDGYDRHGKSQERQFRADRWRGTPRSYRPRRVRADRTLAFVKEQADNIEDIQKDIEEHLKGFAEARQPELDAVDRFRRDIESASLDDYTAALLRFGDDIDFAAELMMFPAGVTDPLQRAQQAFMPPNYDEIRAQADETVAWARETVDEINLTLDVINNHLNQYVYIATPQERRALYFFSKALNRKLLSELPAELLKFGDEIDRAVEEMLKKP